jgi:membrane protein
VIPRAGRLAWRALLRFFDHSGPDRAAAVAYYAILSLIPLLIFLISIGVAVLGSFDAAYRGTLVLFQGVVVHLDPDSIESLRRFALRASRFHLPGLLLLAWTSRRIFSSLFTALDAVFEVRGRSVAGIFKGHLVALAMVLITGAGLLATLALTAVVAAAEGLLRRLSPPVGGAVVPWFSGVVLTHLVPLALTASFFFLVYRMVPGQAVTTVHAAVGAALATALWEAAKAGFAFYIRSLAHYAGLYGALEAVIVLALWLQLSVSIVLYAGEVVALLQLGTPDPPAA